MKVGTLAPYGTVYASVALLAFFDKRRLLLYTLMYMGTITKTQFRNVIKGMQTGGKGYMAGATRKAVMQSRIAQKAWSGTAQLTSSGLKRVVRELAAKDPKSFSATRAKNVAAVMRGVMHEEESAEATGSLGAKDRFTEGELRIKTLRAEAHERAVQERIRTTGASQRKYDLIAEREKEYATQKKAVKQNAANPRDLAKRAMDLAI